MCFVFIWGQTATCATYSINWLVFITEMKSVYSAVRTGSLNEAVCASSLTFESLLVTWCTNSLTFNNCTLCPHCIYVFCIHLRTNSYLCHLQHKLIGFYNRDEKYLQRRTDWVFKWSSLRFVFNLLKTRRSLLCIRNQTVPRCKHFPPWL